MSILVTLGFILFVLSIIFVLVKYTDNSLEHFYGDYIIPWATRVSKPTRNMSYDLRGEASEQPLQMSFSTLI